ncbi:hypothetical protein L6452_14930 [Arctium lappa]|uniref:Uncharacterized protein n=1 Tax=Arctium lappa TaxID=4217 RepID=A0ACB9CMG5_ARCLA|nr:hypothetical protein L6452_14930 [Arctium lappa]
MARLMAKDVFIVFGDDCVAVKSGWDEYGRLETEIWTIEGEDEVMDEKRAENSGGVVETKNDYKTVKRSFASHVVDSSKQSLFSSFLFLPLSLLLF